LITGIIFSIGEKAVSDIQHSNNGTASIIPAILIPLPDHDFDPTEATIPRKACRDQGWKVTISTEHGNVPQTDLNRLKGPLPGLVSASAKTQEAYELMSHDPSFQHPITYSEIVPDQYEAIILPGGDAPRMRQYLENTVLQGKVVEFFQKGMLVGALCHGILVLARTIDPQTGHSVLYGHKLTALPKSFDLFGYRIDRLLLKHGYIMYPQCVADEVRLCLEHHDDFINGPGLLSPYVYSDGNLITSRWYMDAEVFAARFVDELRHRMIPESVTSGGVV
jgi:putative intracellular protease/amidase